MHRLTINFCNAREAKDIIVLHNFCNDAITLRSVWTHFLDHWAEQASDIHVFTAVVRATSLCITGINPTKNSVGIFSLFDWV